jgi:cob(I)alamin adenosyltransferase
MSNYFTRSGDDGYTGMLGEGRIPKYHPRAEAVGAIDEATAALGFARSISRSERVISTLQSVQRDLYHLMAEVAATQENAARFRVIDSAKIDWLESEIENLGREMTLPNEFILPGDSTAGGALDLARTVVRRAERRIALLLHNKEIENPFLLSYLNRLSSLCFVMELYENQLAGNDAPSLAKSE